MPSSFSQAGNPFCQSRSKNPGITPFLKAPEAEVRTLLDKNQPTRIVVTDGEQEESLLGVVHILALVQYVPLPLDDKPDYHTIAGLLMELLQCIPAPGEEVVLGVFCLKTLAMESHWVQKVHCSRW